MTAKSPDATFYPYVLYRDAEAGIDWLERSLGFARDEVHRNEDGTIAHAELSLGSAIVMVATAGAGREPFSALPAGTALVYCAVGDVDALCDRARTAGADIPLGPTDTDYGSRDFAVRDPEGNLWSFGTYRPERTE